MERKGARPLSEAISAFLKEIGYRKSPVLSELAEAWQETVGPEVSAHARLAGWKRGVLFVEVDSAAWLQELSSFYKDEILENIRAKLSRIHVADLKFKLVQRENKLNGKSS
jgi:predicted nucleic acid-binding Zn ribbon protein